MESKNKIWGNYVLLKYKQCKAFSSEVRDCGKLIQSLKERGI